MSKGKTTVDQAVTPHKFTADEFAERYRKLVEETGFQIVFEPRWARSMDTGDYRLIIVSSVAQVTKEA